MTRSTMDRWQIDIPFVGQIEDYPSIQRVMSPCFTDVSTELSCQTKKKFEHDHFFWHVKAFERGLYCIGLNTVICLLLVIRNYIEFFLILPFIRIFKYVQGCRNALLYTAILYEGSLGAIEDMRALEEDLSPPFS